MKTLILYDTKTGNTEKVAQAIAQTLVDLKQSPVMRKITPETSIDLLEFDLVFIGTPVIDWLPSVTVMNRVKQAMKGHVEQKQVKLSSPKLPGKYAVCFCTYGGPHTGEGEAVPATLWLRSFVEHLGFTHLDSWHVPGQFHSHPESDRLNREGRLGNITGRPDERDCRDIAGRVIGLLKSIGADSEQPCRSRRPHRPTSFWMHDPELVFQELNLATGKTFLDAGCGLGDYAMRAAQIVGESGTVYALDRTPEHIEDLHLRAESQGWTHIKGFATDLTRPLPLADGVVDVCLMATVLHILDLDKNGEALFAEINRVLKLGARVVTIDCKSEDDSIGPPLSMRVAPETIKALAAGQQWKKINSLDLGFNYLLHFEKQA